MVQNSNLHEVDLSWYYAKELDAQTELYTHHMSIIHASFMKIHWQEKSYEENCKSTEIADEPRPLFPTSSLKEES